MYDGFAKMGSDYVSFTFFYAQKTDVLHGDLKRKKVRGFQKDSSCKVEPTMLDGFGKWVELHTLRLFRCFFGSRLWTPLHRAL